MPLPEGPTTVTSAPAWGSRSPAAPQLSSPAPAPLTSDRVSAAPAPPPAGAAACQRSERQAAGDSSTAQVAAERAGPEGRGAGGVSRERRARSSRLSGSPIDWLRVIARFSLLPAAFNDPLTGRDVGLASVLRTRQRRLRDNRLPASKAKPP